MKCPSCLTEIPDGSQYCMQCGNKIDTLRKYTGLDIIESQVSATNGVIKEYRYFPRLWKFGIPPLIASILCFFYIDYISFGLTLVIAIWLLAVGLFFRKKIILYNDRIVLPNPLLFKIDIINNTDIYDISEMELMASHGWVSIKTLYIYAKSDNGKQKTYSIQKSMLGSKNEYQEILSFLDEHVKNVRNRSDR